MNLMKKTLILFLLIFQPIFLHGGIDNYLFTNKKACLACLDEINSSKRAKLGESFDCKGRYGEKQQNKYFVMRYFTKGNRTENKQHIPNASGENLFFFKHDFLIKQQNGLNESSIKNLCPIIHKNQNI